MIFEQIKHNTRALHMTWSIIFQIELTSISESNYHVMVQMNCNEVQIIYRVHYLFHNKYMPLGHPSKRSTSVNIVTIGLCIICCIKRYKSSHRTHVLKHVSEGYQC